MVIQSEKVNGICNHERDTHHRTMNSREKDDPTERSPLQTPRVVPPDAAAMMSVGVFNQMVESESPISQRGVSIHRILCDHHLGIALNKVITQDDAVRTVFRGIDSPFSRK
jgi:hypothetical protein